MKLNYKRTFLVGLAFMTISGFWQLYDFIIPLILKNEFNVSDTAAGIVMSLDNVLALFLLPLFGSLSDGVDTSMGKRMPFILIGSMITIVSMNVLPFAAESKNIILFTLGLAFVLISLASYRSPAVALMPDITVKPLRSKANAIINLMGAVGGVIVLLMISLLSPEKTGSYRAVFYSVSIFIFLSILIMFLNVKEKKWALEMIETSKHIEYFEDDNLEVENILDPEIKTSMLFLLMSISLWFMGYNAVISAFSRYAVNHLSFTSSQASNVLLIANIAAIISFIPIGQFSSKFGRKKTILIGVMVLTFSFGSAFAYNTYHWLMILNFVLAGVSWAAINVNSLPMVLEMTSGNNTGKFTGLYYTFSMSAQIITPILSGLLFDYFGYSVLFPYAAFFLFMSFITMTNVHHGDSILSDYESRD